MYVLICDSHGSCKSPMGNGEFLYVFFYISHYVCVPCLFQCYALTSEVNFTLSLIFLSDQLILYPTIHSFYSLDVFFPFDSVYISVFPSLPNVSTMCTLVLCAVSAVHLTHLKNKTPKYKQVILGLLLLKGILS